jgi:Ni/Co efflux regulator RcnB
MRKLLAALCFMFATAPFALAQNKATETPKKAPSEKQQAQQDRMKQCNAKAGEKKGEERKKYMSTCLKGEDAGPSAKQKAQQDKMTACNKEASGKNLKGDERKQFMSSCLKG